jgi:sugar phosphate permease
MALFGFFQLNCWPISVNIVYDYFSVEKDGKLIGLWTASGSFGNVVGYLFPSLMILRLLLPWQIPLLIFCSFSVLSTAGVYLFVKKRQ